MHGRAYRHVVADRVPDDCTDTRIQQVLHQNVLCVLGTDGARFEQCEATLHEEDEEPAEHQPEGVADLAIEVDPVGLLRNEFQDGRVGRHGWVPRSLDRRRECVVRAPIQQSVSGCAATF